MRPLLAVLLAAACGSSGSKAMSDTTITSGGGTRGDDTGDPIPATPGPECAIVAERVAQVALAEQPKGQPQATEVLRKRCTEDRWSDDARSCLATVETDDELQGCRKHLSEAQQQTVDHDMDAFKGGTPATAPPPPAKSKGTTRGSIPRTGADPCEGGE